MGKKRSNEARWYAGDFEGEFRIEAGTLFCVVEGMRVAKKVGNDWVTLVPGWVVAEGYGASLDPDIPSGPMTSVVYEPDYV
jgi:hypothetical protein